MKLAWDIYRWLDFALVLPLPVQTTQRGILELVDFNGFYEYYVFELHDTGQLNFSGETVSGMMISFAAIALLKC